LIVCEEKGKRRRRREKGEEISCKYKE